MASEENIRIVGRDDNGTPRQALVDENSSLKISDTNVGITYPVSYQSNSTGSYVILTVDNSTVGSTTLTFNAQLVPNWGVARSIWINCSGALSVVVKVYGIDLNGYEIIFYVTTNGTTNVTVGNTLPNGTGASVNLTTQLRHINRLEELVPRTGALPIIYANCNIIASGGASILTRLCYNTPLYSLNPIYCCPMGRRAKFKGFQMISASAQNTYSMIVYRKPSNTSVSGVHPISFPIRFVINDFSALSQNSNDYMWSDEGLVTVNEGEWLFLNRESGTVQTNIMPWGTVEEFRI
jgi:hypothetical protein